eukprot:GHVU01121930.1.p1 GENE.GHVU01121930.1~~GHVU01121930.1.p1  ORF type:complete len:193 (-),score=16.55 GHVU01121930.1:423-1001(-)
MTKFKSVFDFVGPIEWTTTYKGSGLTVDGRQYLAVTSKANISAETLQRVQKRSQTSSLLVLESRKGNLALPSEQEVRHLPHLERSALAHNMNLRNDGIEAEVPQRRRNCGCSFDACCCIHKKWVGNCLCGPTSPWCANRKSPCCCGDFGEVEHVETRYTTGLQVKRNRGQKRYRIAKYPHDYKPLRRLLSTE